MEGPPVWEVSGGRGRQTAPDLQDTRQGGKPEADRADRELGPAPFRRRGLWVLGAGDPKGGLCGQ